jgi:hypothetical protein
VFISILRKAAEEVSGFFFFSLGWWDCTARKLSKIQFLGTIHAVFRIGSLLSEAQRLQFHDENTRVHDCSIGRHLPAD